MAITLVLAAAICCAVSVVLFMGLMRLQDSLNLYHSAVQHARELGLQIPTVIEIADEAAFPQVAGKSKEQAQ